MFAVNHKDITEDALKLEIDDKNALTLIKGANEDSDVLGRFGGGASHLPQHFCRSKNQSSLIAIDNAKKFLTETLFNAKKLLLLGFVGDDKNYVYALYFLGRGLHCAQDFYAHSNWIVLEGRSHKNWDTNEVPNDLKLCVATPTMRQGDNILPTYYPPHLAGYIAMGQVKKAERLSLAEMRNPKEETLHPNMNFDWSYSWASQVYEDLFPGGENGYQRARDLAVRETDRLWHRFSDSVEGSQAVFDTASKKTHHLVGREAWRAFMEFRFPKKVSWKEMRRVFNKQIPGGVAGT